jgi:uncharacterized membrane protein
LQGSTPIPRTANGVHVRQGAVTLAALLASLAASSAASGAAAPPAFFGLGDLEGGAFFSAVSAISADGSVVVGTSHVEPGAFETCFGGPQRGYRWTEATGMEPLSDAFPADVCGCAAVSSDGSTIACSNLGIRGNTVFILRGTEVETVPHPTGGFLDSITALSADGEFATGVMINASGHIHALRWQAGAGADEIEDLGDLPGGIDMSAGRGISGAGEVVVGASGSEWSNPKSTMGEAFRWTAGQGMQGLGDLDGGDFISAATAVTADGAVVVGEGRSSNGIEAFRWTQTTGLQPLGDLAEPPFHSSATSVSHDGQIVIGVSEPATPFIWDPRRGMRSVAEFLAVEIGLDIADWSLEMALISGDGRTLAGRGTNPAGDTEAWVARLGPRGDLDHDGDVDGADLGALLAAWQTPAITPDLNFDGIVDGADLGVLLSHWTG